jgi:hypothetical protein
VFTCPVLYMGGEPRVFKSENGRGLPFLELMSLRVGFPVGGVLWCFFG